VDDVILRMTVAVRGHIPPSQGPILPAKVKRLLMPLAAARSCLCVLCGVALNIEVRV
jgi:hypothetical protein